MDFIHWQANKLGTLAGFIRMKNYLRAHSLHDVISLDTPNVFTQKRLFPAIFRQLLTEPLHNGYIILPAVCLHQWKTTGCNVNICIVRVRVRVIGHLYTAILWDEPIARKAQIWPVIARGSHSFTCHPLTNHTCLYSPAAGHHRPLAGTHCAYPWRDGQAELTWVAGYIPT